MLQTMKQIFASGGLPVAYRRTPVSFGNEAEIRWRRHHNSRVVSIKVDYNISDAEHAECAALFASECRRNAAPPQPAS